MGTSTWPGQRAVLIRLWEGQKGASWAGGKMKVPHLGEEGDKHVSTGG